MKGDIMKNKKAIVTLLGMISYSKPDYIIQDGKVKKIFVDIAEKDRAEYLFSEDLNAFAKKLNNNRYINTLHLLVDGFSERDIIPIATQKAKDIQIKTLDFLEVDKSCLDNTVIIDESKYEEFFQKISELLQKKEYESFIIDLTHGFRHLPILMIVNLIIASMKENDKIEHIFFAKEIDSSKKYEIIDLLDYIGLAKLSFVLENFNTNYTVGNKLVFRNELYQDLVDNLRIISGHILANSIKALIDRDDNLIRSTIEKFEELRRNDTKVATFSNAIDNIIKHLKKIEILKDKADYIKLFKLSQMMKNRDYLLNSITLLNESIGMYCAELIESIAPKHIKAYKVKEYFSMYELSHSSKNIILKEKSFKGSYLFEPNKKVLTAGQKTSLQKKKKRLKKCIDIRCIDEIEKSGFKIELNNKDIIKTDSIKNIIIDKLSKQDNEQLKKLIEDISNLRNNLAHGNSSEEIENVKGTITLYLNRYQKIAKILNNIDKEDIIPM